MKRINKLLGLGFLTTLVVLSCTKIAPVPVPTIDLGVKSQATNIKSITQDINTVTAVFETTPGANIDGTRYLAVCKITKTIGSPP